MITRRNLAALRTPLSGTRTRREEAKDAPQGAASPRLALSAMSRGAVAGASRPWTLQTITALLPQSRLRIQEPEPNQAPHEKTGMRALLISDVHSNLEALKAVLAAAPQHDAVWNLGDTVGYGASPNEVVEIARRLVGTVIRGNHDKACSGRLSRRELLDFSATARFAVSWTQNVLSADSKNWLSSLPRGPRKLLGRKVGCVHGSPWNEDEYIILPDDAEIALGITRTRITLFGHTHLQRGWSSKGGDLTRIRPEFRSDTDAEQFELPLRRGNRYLINPGSVGQPPDGDWRAAFAVYDEIEAVLTWHRVPYDVQTAQTRILEAGLPEALAIRLRKVG
jgi:diadenosine tetraphosphatase ApaH/serine/threonine PP2A family protein phosphatase